MVEKAHFAHMLQHEKQPQMGLFLTVPSFILLPFFVTYWHQKSIDFESAGADGYEWIVCRTLLRTLQY